MEQTPANPEHVSPWIEQACAGYNMTRDMLVAHQQTWDACPDWTKFSNNESTNNGVERYGIARQLFEMGLLAERHVAIRKDGVFRGYHIYHRQICATPHMTREHKNDAATP